MTAHSIYRQIFMPLDNFNARRFSLLQKNLQALI